MACVAGNMQVWKIHIEDIQFRTSDCRLGTRNTFPINTSYYIQNQKLCSFLLHDVKTWPIHLQRLFIRMVDIGSVPHRSKRSLFGMTLGEKMRKVRRRLLVQAIFFI